MESFFLAETTKYLYLLFDTDNFIHNRGQHGTVIQTPHGECVIDAGGYIFNTEAHPIDPSALHCCHELKNDDIFAFTDKLKLFEGNSLDNYKANVEPPEPEVETIVELPLKQTTQKLQTGEGTVEIVRLSKEDKDQEKASAVKVENTSEVDNLKENVNLTSNSSNILQLVPEFLQKYIKPEPKKFDAQVMLNRIKADLTKYPRNSSWESNYSLLSCRAQPFLQRLSLIGEFFD